MSGSYPAELSFGPESRVVLIATPENPADKEFLPYLPQVKASVDELRRVLTDPDVVGLPPHAVIPLIDVAEPSQIASGVAKAAKEATDTLVVYYIGHGLHGRGETPLYLVARNSTDAGKDYDALSINTVRKAMRESPARKRLLVLDCCYSGRALGNELSSASAEAAAPLTIDVDGTYGIAAVPGGAKALAREGETYTRFTGAMLDVLKGGADIDAPVLTLEQVFEEVKRRIHRMADAPLPERANWNGAAHFRFVRNSRLRGAELRRLADEVAGLRQQALAAEKRLAAAEAASTALGAIVQRLAPLDAALAAQGARLDALEAVAVAPAAAREAEEAEARPDPLAERLNIHAGVWRRMPATVKAEVAVYFEGRRNGLYALAGVGCVFYAGATMAALSTNEKMTQAALACAAALSLAALPLLTVQMPRAKGPAPSERAAAHDPEVEHELITNGQLLRASEQQPASIFGNPIDIGRARLAGMLALAGAIVLAITLYWYIALLVRG